MSRGHQNWVPQEEGWGPAVGLRHTAWGRGHTPLVPGQPRPFLKKSGWDNTEGDSEMWLTPHCCVALIRTDHETVQSSVWGHHRAKPIPDAQGALILQTPRFSYGVGTMVPACECACSFLFFLF